MEKKRGMQNAKINMLKFDNLLVAFDTIFSSQSRLKRLTGMCVFKSLGQHTLMRFANMIIAFLSNDNI